MNKIPVVMYKTLVIGIILLLICMSITPSVAVANLKESNIPTSDKSVIIVDDEGDGDYTSIKDAVNNVSSGDIIEIYSGTYVEDDIQIEKPEISLKGLPYELGSGSDTGKPLIIRESYEEIFMIRADGVTITGLRMEDEGGVNTRYQWHFIDLFEVDRCIISNNTLCNGSGYSVGIYCVNCHNIQILNNNIIDMVWEAICLKGGGDNTVSGNIITDSCEGIYIYESSNNEIIKNKIYRCSVSIYIHQGFNNSIYLNQFENNSKGIYFSWTRGNIVKHNNFIKNSKDVVNENIKCIIIQRWSTVLNKWLQNYWDTWIGIGPKIIFGWLFLIFLLIPFFPPFWIFPIGFPIPFIQFDWHPAQEPYDIEGVI